MHHRMLYWLYGVFPPNTKYGNQKSGNPQKIPQLCHIPFWAIINKVRSDSVCLGHLLSCPWDKRMTEPITIHLTLQILHLRLYCPITADVIDVTTIQGENITSNMEDKTDSLHESTAWARKISAPPSPHFFVSFSFIWFSYSCWWYCCT